MITGYSIDYLANHSASVPALAKYSYDEWKTVYEHTGKTLEDVLSSYQERANVNSLPLALVAIHDGQVIGTISLKIQDLDIRPAKTPWLGGLFVIPQWRRHGVATALIHRLIQEAYRLGIRRLYLWTPSAESLYARLGWSRTEQLDYCGYQITIMHKDLSR